MRHRVAGKKLGRSTGHRRALYRNLVSELFRHERIQTTEAKARAVRPIAERIVTKARKARADRVVELAKKRDVERLSAWFNPKRADQLVAFVEQGDDAALAKLAGELALHARRQVASVVIGNEVVRKLVDEIGPRFDDRPGGYTRMVKLGLRKGDAARMAVLELLEE